MSEKFYETFMRVALEEADKAAATGEVPVGAVIVFNGEIIARGYNKIEGLNDPTAHGEMEVIRKAADILGNWRLTGCDVYVTLEPCSMCAGAMVAARINRIFYGAQDSKFGGCGSIFSIPNDPRLNHQIEVVGGVLADECAARMKSFFQDVRKRNHEKRMRCKVDTDM